MMNHTLQEHLDRTMRAARAAQFAESDQLSLGQIIDECKSIRVRDGDDEQKVVFDFEYASPVIFESWRGVYAELSLTFDFNSDKTLTEFLKMAEGAVGKTFEGYKGGDYTMTRDTPVWVANYSHTGSTAITGVYDDGWQVVLITGYRST